MEHHRKAICSHLLPTTYRSVIPSSQRHLAAFPPRFPRLRPSPSIIIIIIIIITTNFLAQANSYDLHTRDNTLLHHHLTSSSSVVLQRWEHVVIGLGSRVIGFGITYYPRTGFTTTLASGSSVTTLSGLSWSKLLHLPSACIHRLYLLQIRRFHDFASEATQRLK